MKDLFKKMFGMRPKSTVHERKFQSYATQPISSNYLSVTPERALRYYETVAPVNTAVSMIAGEASAMDLAVMSSDGEDLIYDHPVLDLLKTPNADTVQEEFLKQISVFFQSTGNAFVLATGPVNRPPLELYAVNPTAVELVKGKDGYTDIMKVYGDQGVVSSFTRKEVDGRFRFFDREDAELWHIKDFHPGYGRGQLWGLSQLTCISVEIEQYIEASIHNLSLLKRGARPSGAVKVNEMLTDEQYQRLQQQLERFYSGSTNAGRSMILEGGDFVQMSQTNRDMDFATLKSEITKTIYAALGVPIALVTTEASTFNNLETAKLMFYDNAVLPLIDRILDELTAFLMIRFDRTGTLRLVYDVSTVEALEPRRNEEIQKLQAAGVLTINEIRKQMGFDPLKGGDTIYINSSLMPLEDGGLDASRDEVANLLAREAKPKE